MTHLHLTFLGQPRITLGDEPFLDFASEKWVGLLAYLSLTGETFARTQLETLLWGDSPQENAQTSLRTAVYNINKRLDNPLQTSRKAVWFAPDQPVTVDVQQFRSLLQQGDNTSLETAVALYRGDLLAGLAIADAPEFEMWLLQQRERLRLELMSALETLIEQHLKSGNFDAAITYSRRLLQVEPWRESTHRELMLLLARSGETNAAIRQYQLCAEMLEAELAIEPSPETEALYQRILTLRQQPPNWPLPAAPSLVGRAAELVQLNAHLFDPECRLLVITGMGGMGKTSLALALGERQNRAFLDGVCFVSLAELETPALLETAVADALHITLPPGVAPRQHLAQQLKPRELLLILDNAEHLLTAVTELVQTLLAAAPGLKIVLTSRELPRLRSARSLALIGLPLPEETESDSPATDLFVQQARRVQPDFSVEAAWPHVVTLCQLLEGSPLGIELAAAQLDLVDCAELAARVQSTIAGLAVDYQDMPLRHRSLRALFEHSWGLLAAPEQRALARLAVFRGGFTAVTANQIAEVTEPVLRTLLAKSLLQRLDGRFALHALIRQFALGHLPAATAVFQRHAHYFSQQLLASSSGHLPAQPSELLAELDNIRAMWQFAIRQRDSELLAEATHGLARLYAVTNQFTEGQILFDQAVTALAETAVPQTAPVVWGELLGRLAMFLFRTGSLPMARETAEQSVAVLRETAADEALAFSLNLLATLYIQSGTFEAAVPLLNECAAIYRQADNPGLLKPLVNLSSLYMRLGQYAAAIQQLNEALPLAESLGDKRGMIHILNNLGANYLALDELEPGQKHLMACLALAEEMQYQPVQMVVLQNLAEVSCKQGAWPQALAHCAAGLAIAAEIEDTLHVIRIQKIQALALFATGEAAQAWQILRQAVQAGFAAETLPGLMDVLTGVGTLLLAIGETAVASDLLQFVMAHPATERQYVHEAEELLTQAGVSMSEASEAAKRPLSDIIQHVLETLPT